MGCWMVGLNENITNSTRIELRLGFSLATVSSRSRYDARKYELSETPHTFSEMNKRKGYNSYPNNGIQYLKE